MIQANRHTGSFKTAKDKKKYWVLLITFLALGALMCIGLLFYNNPVPVGSSSFKPVVERRITSVVAMIIAALCHSFSTVSFQTITNNRVITPSLLGFEALHTTIHTAIIFFLGSRQFVEFEGVFSLLLEIAIMVLVCLILYGTLLSGKYGDMQFMLLIGIILGTGLKSLSTFMRRLLAPSEFDLLQSKLYGSVNNADKDYFPIVIPIVIIAAFLLYKNSKELNLVSVGKDVTITLGGNHQKVVIKNLILISILMVVTTSLIGPLNFYGFLTATLSYQAAKTYDHKYILPMAFAIALLIITGAYFIMYHVFNAQGVVSVIIEMFGGLIFLFVVLRKGSL